jgi:uncharacterized protein with HEPN domain
VARSDAERCNDILISITAIRKYLPLMADSTRGEMAYDAILRHVGIIGEAAEHLSGDVKKSTERISLPEIAGLGHRVVDEYFHLDRSAVIAGVEKILSPLEVAVQQILSFTQAPHP